MSLESIEYEERIIDGCKCEISYYKCYSYITFREIYNAIRINGRVTDSFLLERITDMRKNLFLQELNVR